jgi:2-dehydropantoate 2-reductase
MTVAIVGAGAIGGLLGARLARAGEDVILIARGAHLRALHADGITVRGRNEEIRVELAATDDVTAIHGADVVFITLKSHAIPGLAPMIGDSLKHDALIVGAMNGIPWWYFRDRHLESVDPGGVIAGSIPYEQVIGSVVYPAATLVAPGVVEHEEGERFTLGEPDGSKSDRVQALARLLSAAGFKAPVQTRIRNEIWLKVVGNATLNPLSAITRATMGEIFAAEDSRRLVQTLMQEVACVARAHDVELPLTIEKRMEGAAAMGGHKTSMLQDIEAGKRLETDALLGAVIELAEAREIDVPSLRELYVLTKLAEAVALAKG